MNTYPFPRPGGCIGYLRVSTERQAGEHQTSLADQEAAILATAARLGLVVDCWYRDAGASGASIEARPAFRALIESCEAAPCSPRDVGTVLVLNDSRFGRFPDPDEAAAIRFRLKQSGWHVRFCEGDEIQDVTFRSVVRSLGSAQASEYRRNIQRNARRGAKGAAEQGFWTREAPIGYRRKIVYPQGAERVLEPGQRKASTEKVKLEPHDEEAALVRWIFEAYASGGHSLGSLVRELATRWPGRRWSRTVVQHLLKNPAYMGDIVGGKRPADKTERQITPTRPKSEWYGLRDAHPPIVSRELFAAVQSRLAKNARSGRAAHSSYLLTGLLRCTYCGSPYTGGGVGSKRLRGGRHFYRDRGGIEGECPAKIGTVMRHLIDPAVIGAIGKVASHPSMAKRIERALDDALRAARSGSESSISTLQKSLRKAEQRRDRLVSAVANGTLLEAEASGQMAATRAEIDGLRSQVEAHRFGQRRTAGLDAERDRLLTLALDFPGQAQRLKGAALRKLVEPWIDSATFNKATRELTLEIRRVPGLQLDSLPRPTGRKQTLTRRISLLQPGYEAEVERRLEEIAAARRAG